MSLTPPETHERPALMKDFKKAHNAAQQGEDALLSALLRKNPDWVLDGRLLNGAALFGRVSTARLLISAGADPDAQVASHEYYRPLHRAIEHRGVEKNDNHQLVVEMLLKAGASLEKRATWMQLVPLAVAGMAGDQEMVSLLLQKGAKEDIFSAAILADTGRMRRFLKRKSAATSKDINNMTVLHYAALSGLSMMPDKQRQMAEMLLDAGADGDAKEKIGPYPPTPVLHFAAWKNDVVAEVLLRRGCNPNLGFGNCLWKPPGRMAELFWSYGADVNGLESSGQPLLNSRIHWNLPSVALWLLKNGANPNLTDKQGNTALHEAVQRGINLNVIQTILEAGGRKDARNSAGLTPYALAKAKKRQKMLSLLK